MRITYTICFAFSLLLLSGCSTKGQTLSLLDLLQQKPQDIFTSKKIPFQQNEIKNAENYRVKLYGEKLPDTVLRLIEPEYGINWEKEEIQPVISCFSVPLQMPCFIVDTTGKPLIVIADVGNDGPKGKVKAGVFKDEDVLDLKKALTEQFGKEKLVKKDSFEGAVYVWKKGALTIRLTIENENFENKSAHTRNGIAQDGRNGVLTIYNGVSPAFHSEENNYFNNPDIRK
ncbi:hypothetical protein SAMN05421788_109232 [Filimonas lacunae]|uniref:Lipoprotein n=1 Tax=Filimonas lacunae TaxID=477680 RepID=A0A173MJ27_9BACT|nr:hypothetical protein [Filimonas lacunae]BAV07411.1 hypothetical protein FLA_3436 [Filimonas lacunae]SIT30466.1 hypothetical protein SAMN05421788_109232 [Filimonas lacunae]